MPYSQPININFAYFALFTIAHFFPLVFFGLVLKHPHLPLHVMSLHVPFSSKYYDGSFLDWPTSKEQATYPTQFMLIPITQTTLDFHPLNFATCRGNVLCTYGVEFIVLIHRAHYPTL